MKEDRRYLWFRHPRRYQKEQIADDASQRKLRLFREGRLDPFDTFPSYAREIEVFPLKRVEIDGGPPVTLGDIAQYNRARRMQGLVVS